MTIKLTKCEQDLTSVENLQPACPVFVVEGEFAGTKFSGRIELELDGRGGSEELVGLEKLTQDEAEHLSDELYFALYNTPAYRAAEQTYEVWQISRDALQN